MFARIMAVVMAAILITTLGLSAVWWFSMRNQQIDARLDYLISEAQDIAYLAGNVNGTEIGTFWGSTTRSILGRKAEKVNREFGAYIAVVDRAGNVMDNMRTAYSEDPEFVSSISGEDISAALERILSGETIRIRLDEGSAPTFTVGVPFMEDRTVIGAVFIQTKAQRIESGLSEMAGRIALITGGIMLLSGAALFLFIRSAMKPLNKLTEAAGAIAEGDFSPRLDEKRGDRKMRQVNEAFNTMTRKLENLEESRREFVSNVSHELHTPITSIRGFAEGMADGVIPPEEHPKYLRLVADESTRLSGLVDDLLALSRLERDDVKPDYSVFDINEMLRRAIIRRMEDLDRKNIDVSCDPEVDPCPVRADSDRIEQVVINLLDNAIKFTPEGGKITLSSRVRNGKAEVTVRDNGAGIAPEDREKVFDRFFTADRAHTSGKGTGLGLSICQRIMEMHGQTIRLLDTDEGAAFRFTLEAAETPEAAPENRTENEAEEASGEESGNA
ncbi:MAG: HAMP domain-containing histidine kinase [Clostridiales bacterium]|nr:HAMP domain-containing histidine kinase [Clostridiales bacterium]